MTETYRPARLGAVELGRGAPKIIVPLTASTPDELHAQIAQLDYAHVDIVEWRVDHYAEAFEPDAPAYFDQQALLAALRALRDELDSGVPILFTFRSSSEGGQREIAPDTYEEIQRTAYESELVDAIDVEMFTELGPLERMVNGAHAAGLVVVMSSHDFERTPPIEQITARLSLQQDLGADVVKIAVMPQNPDDVLTLLRATSEFATGRGVRPAITMAMGPLGVVSRLAGETFGSTATFGSAGAASAPGQMPARALRAALDAIHDAQV